MLKSNLKRQVSPVHSDGPVRKHVKIAAKVKVIDDNVSAYNSSLGQSYLSSSLDTSELRSQFSKIQVDSGIELSMLSGRETLSSESETSQAHSVQKGLPRPKLYGSSRRKQNLSAGIRTTPSSLEKSEGKHKQSEGTPILKLEKTPVGRGQSSLVAINDGSQGINEILASIEKDLSTPMKHLLRTPPKEVDKNLLTSTPFKGPLGSPLWMSPIHGLTPIPGDLMEVAIVTPDLTAGVSASTSTPITPDNKLRRSPRLKGISLTPVRSPGLNTPGHISEMPNSPFKDINNQSFSKLMADFHLDSFIDDGIHLDVSNMSFSALQ